VDKPTPPTEPTRAALRASDMDRERVAALLRDHFSDGRLTLEEFQERLESAYAGKTFGELDALTSDLPVHRTPAAPPAIAPSSDEAVRRRRIRDRILTYVILMLFLIAIWAVSGREGSFWPIWPILVGGLILAFDVLGLERPGRRGRHRRMDRHQRRENSDRPPRDG